MILHTNHALEGLYRHTYGKYGARALGDGDAGGGWVGVFSMSFTSLETHIERDVGLSTLEKANSQVFSSCFHYRSGKQQRYITSSLALPNLDHMP